MYLHSSQYYVHPDYGANFTLSVYNDSQGISRFSGSGTLLREILKVKIGVVSLAKRNGSQEYSQVIFKTEVDLCRMQKGIFGNLAFKILKESFESNSNLDLKCPVKKGFYFCKDFPMLDVQKLPIFVIHAVKGNSRDWQLTVTFKGKSEKSKTIELLLNVRFYGRTIF
jgi:Protein of unknown function (DUF1091)